jgi:predicted dehydrogenase
MTHSVPKQLAAIGSGAAFGFYEKALEQSKTAKFIAIVDPTRTPGRDSNGRKVVNGLHELRGLQLDAVVIMSPNCHHAEQAIEAIRFGFPVLCEKPLAISVKDAVRAIDCADEHRLWLQMAMHCRYRPEIEYLYRNIDGPITYFEQRYLEDWMSASAWFFDPKVSGGGVLLDVGINQIDWLFPLVAPMTVTDAHCELGGGKVEVECRIEWGWNGGSGRTELSWRAVNREKRSLVVTKPGTRFELDHQQHTAKVNGQRRATEQCREYQKVIAAFLSDLPTDPRPDFRAIHVLQLLRSAYQCAGLRFLE